MKKRIVSLLLALALILPLCPAFELPLLSLPVSAATSGTTGGCSWALDGTVLTISGSGKMGNYSTTYQNGTHVTTAPWGVSITSVVIEDGVTSIGGYAFYGCSSLATITIPDSVTSIGDWAFRYCSSLAAIAIPDSVKSIGESAFAHCDSLTTITIGNGVTSIGKWAFADCSSLTAITIGNSVTSIGDYAFRDCSSLTSITVAEGNPVYHSAGNCLIETESKTLAVGCPNSIIPSDGSVTSIGTYAFIYCSSLTTITIPDSVTSIGVQAFYYCRSLTSVTISNSVTSIGEYAFYGCSSLDAITIPDSVTSIGGAAFVDCTSLTAITIPDSVTSIGENAFYNCSSLTTVWYEGSASDQNKISIEYGNSALTSATWHYNSCMKNEGVWTHVYDSACDADCNECGAVRAVPAHVYDNKVDVSCNECGTERTLPYDDYGVTGDCFWYREGTVLTISGNGKMGDNKYRGPWGTYITKVIIENGVTSIGKAAFEDCDRLTSVTIPDTVTSIGDSAFYNCKKLISVSIPDSVTRIGARAFNSCYDLISISIPDGVVSIGGNTFQYCTDLTSVTIPNSVTSIGISAFAGCVDLATITIPDSVTSIGNTAFHDCSSLTAITIPDSVTSIGGGAFWDCSSLTAITIPDSVASIGDTTFSGCSSLATVTLPDSVTSIGNHAFNGCSSLTAIAIPDSVTSIGYNVFYGCSSLTTITIPDSVTSIGNRAFEGCSSLTAITLPDSVTSIGYGVFDRCSSLTAITLPDTVTSIGNYAFRDCSSLTTVWYEGSESDRSDISIGSYNDKLTSATWHYVDNACDADCNECGEIRIPPHVFDDASDVLCNECGYSKVQVATSLSLSVEERIYLNLWLDAVDVAAYKALTGKDFTYDATVGERSLGAGSVTGAPVETEYGTYYIIRLDAVSANLFGEQISIDCPTGVINAVGDEDLTVLDLAKGGIAQYQDQKVKDLFTALYNYGASVMGEAPLDMPVDFVQNQEDDIQVTAKTNKTASFQRVYLLMGDSIGIRLKGKLLGDENALSVKVNGNETNACKLNVGADGTLTIDLYVSADHFNTDLTIEVYSGEDVIASFIGSVKGYSEQIADQDAKTLALAQFVQACVNYKAA